MILAGTSNEDIKYLISKRYEKDNYVLIDDLFILGLENCKQSNIEFVVICPELIESEETKELAKFYSTNFKCYQVSQKVFQRLCTKENCAGIIVLTKITGAKSNGTLASLLIDFKTRLVSVELLSLEILYNNTIIKPPSGKK